MVGGRLHLLGRRGGREQLDPPSPPPELGRSPSSLRPSVRPRGQDSSGLVGPRGKPDRFGILISIPFADLRECPQHHYIVKNDISVPLADPLCIGCFGVSEVGLRRALGIKSCK